MENEYTTFATQYDELQIEINNDSLREKLEMLLTALEYFTESFELIKQFSQTSGIDSSLVRTIFKIVGIGYVIELTAASVKDLGFESISDKLILCGRVIIFLASVPVLRELYQVIVSLIGLV